MHAYREFQAELEKLHQQSERARRAEKAKALERIRALIADYGILPAELASIWKPATPAPAAAAKYKNPETGATWTGHGRAPQWIAGKDRSLFEVK